MSLLCSSNFKYPEAQFKKNPEFMDPNHYYQQQNLNNSGLTRYRSAPSSFLESLVNDTNNVDANGGVNSNDHFHYDQSINSEIDAFYAKYASPCYRSGDSISHDLQEFAEKSIKQEETESSAPQQSGYSNGSSQMLYESQQVNSLQNQDPRFSVISSMSMENPMQPKMGTSNGSNLVRQNSSPAGLFSNLGVDIGFSVTRDVGSFRACNGSSRFMPQISEIGNETMGPSSPENRSLNNFRHKSWDEASFGGLKRPREDDVNMFSNLNTLEAQNGNSGYCSAGLTHHLSLTKNSAEITSIEKFLQFQNNSVPCKIRAKRGCATHPRSIAERARRTRISERMRKLQDLFPNMDKQTNTADMLDMAVGYIKDLQKQVKTLTDSKARCMCESKQKQYSNASV